MTGRDSSERGFTLMETAISLVIMMIVGLGAASLFAYATNANRGADDREVAMAVAQKRMEWLRTIQFTTQTRNQEYSYPNGGLAQTSTAGVEETETSAGRQYTVNTIIRDLSFVPIADPDGGAPTVKSIEVSVTPQGTRLGSVTLYTQRSTGVPGKY